MNSIQSLFLTGTIFLFSACSETEQQHFISQKVDAAVTQLAENISSYKKVVLLDHHRMAAESGVYTPPSVVTMFSKPHVETALLQENQLVGLDLPFKVLCYSEPDTLNPSIAFTSAGFISKRHGIASPVLKDYQSIMASSLASFPVEMISVTDISQVEKDFGIIKIKSDFDFHTTIKNLKEVVMSQGDTKWFGDVNYTSNALTLGIKIRPTILLLFGGPAPGGKAMMTSPKIGLDAFCQKLLVFENENGEVWVAYNDIVAFAKLYYSNSTKPQHLINKRLQTTFTKAVTANN